MEPLRDQPIIIKYYTDPYCTWCWGSEPILIHIKESFADQVGIVFKMGGLVEDINSFYDAKNDISGLDQVAPHWLEASARHGMPVDVEVFKDIKDEMTSTFPANIAYKAAELQNPKLAEKYLRRLREGAATERLPIHREKTQIDIAESVGLDADRFSAALKSGQAQEAFEADLHEARSQGISGFPTFIVENQRGDRLPIHGYRAFNYFVSVFKQMSPVDLLIQHPTDISAFVAKYGHVATAEVAEVFNQSQVDAFAALKDLENDGLVKMVPLGNGEFWEPK